MLDFTKLTTVLLPLYPWMQCKPNQNQYQKLITPCCKTNTKLLKPCTNLFQYVSMEKHVFMQKQKLASQYHFHIYLKIRLHQTQQKHCQNLANCRKKQIHKKMCKNTFNFYWFSQRTFTTKSYKISNQLDDPTSELQQVYPSFMQRQNHPIGM